MNAECSLRRFKTITLHFYRGKRSFTRTKGEIRPGAIAWAEYPNFEKSKEGWMSEYLGDEKPNKNGLYLVVFMGRNKIKFPPRILWYDCKKDTFGGSPDAIAWMDVPKPYREVI